MDPVASNAYVKKAGQLRLGIESPLAPISIIEGVYFGTPKGPTSHLVGWCTHFSHILILKRHEERWVFQF